MWGAVATQAVAFGTWIAGFRNGEFARSPERLETVRKIGFGADTNHVVVRKTPLTAGSSEFACWKFGSPSRPCCITHRLTGQHGLVLPLLCAGPTEIPR